MVYVHVHVASQPKVEHQASQPKVEHQKDEHNESTEHRAGGERGKGRGAKGRGAEGHPSDLGGNQQMYTSMSKRHVLLEVKIGFTTRRTITQSTHDHNIKSDMSNHTVE